MGRNISNPLASTTVTSVPLGGYADVFSSGDAYKLVGSTILRSQYPEFSLAFPRKSTYRMTTGPSGGVSTATASLFANGIFVVAGSNSDSPSTSSSTSIDGTVFTPRTITSGAWLALAYGAGMFVAAGKVGGGSSTPLITTSPDGITWTARNAAGGSGITGLVYSAEKGLFVGVCGLGPVNSAVTSPDGITWTNRTLPYSQYWSDVAYGNGVFVAVAGGQSANTQAASSSDGITWTPRGIPNGLWTSVTFGNGLFVAVNAQGGCATSPDGITWTARIIPSLGGANTQLVEYGNGVFLSVGSGAAATSPDGINWTARVMTLSGQTPGSLSYGNGMFLYTIMSGGTTGLFYTENATDSDFLYIDGNSGKYVRVR